MSTVELTMSKAFSAVDSGACTSILATHCLCAKASLWVRLMTTVLRWATRSNGSETCSRMSASSRVSAVLYLWISSATRSNGPHTAVSSTDCKATLPTGAPHRVHPPTSWASLG
eukprot:1181200-Prorocentrum_minimum.AAC.3